MSCNSMLNTSGWAFSISSSRITAYGPAADRLGELAALLVADVARRRADEPRHRVLLHVLRHVDAHHRPLVVEEEVGERARELGLADAGRAEEQERADRAVRIGQPGARAPDRVRHRGDRRRPGRSRARAARLRAARASRARLPSTARRGCRSTWRRSRRRLPRRPLPSASRRRPGARASRCVIASTSRSTTGMWP